MGSSFLFFQEIDKLHWPFIPHHLLLAIPGLWHLSKWCCELLMSASSLFNLHHILKQLLEWEMARTSGSPLQLPRASHLWLYTWKNLTFCPRMTKKQQDGFAWEPKLLMAAAKISARMFQKKGVGCEINRCLTNAHDEIFHRAEEQLCVYPLKEDNGKHHNANNQMKLAFLAATQR